MRKIRSTIINVRLVVVVTLKGAVSVPGRSSVGTRQSPLAIRSETLADVTLRCRVAAPRPPSSSIAVPVASWPRRPSALFAVRLGNVAARSTASCAASPSYFCFFILIRFEIESTKIQIRHADTEPSRTSGDGRCAATETRTRRARTTAPGGYRDGGGGRRKMAVQWRRWQRRRSAPMPPPSPSPSPFHSRFTPFPSLLRRILFSYSSFSHDFISHSSRLSARVGYSVSVTVSQTSRSVLTSTSLVSVSSISELNIIFSAVRT